MARKKPHSFDYKKALKAFIIAAGAIFLSITLLLAGTFFIVKHIKIKDLVENEIEQQLGIKVAIRELGCSPLLTHVYAKGITIYNPPGFKEKELAYLNYVHILWDPLRMVTLSKPDIYVCAVDLERLNIIKNEKGEVNIKQIMPVKNQGKILDDKTPFSVDALILSVGKVIYTANTSSGPKTRVFIIGIKNQTFIGLRDEDAVVRLIIYKAIDNTNIGKMINLAVMPAISGVSDTFDSAWGTAKVGAKGIANIVSAPFKLIFK